MERAGRQRHATATVNTGPPFTKTLALMTKRAKAPPANEPDPRSKRTANALARMFGYEFDVIDEHRVFVYGAIQRSMDSLNKKLATRLTKLGKESRALLDDQHYDEIHQLSQSFPRLQSYAQFLVAFATFEDALNRLCQFAQSRYAHRLSFRDLADQGVRRAANYFRKVVGYAAPFITPDWNRVLVLAELRNTLAHAGGRLSDEPNNKKSLVRRLHGVQGLSFVRPHPQQAELDVVLGEEFLSDAVACFRRVLVEVARFPEHCDEG